MMMMIIIHVSVDIIRVPHRWQNFSLLPNEIVFHIEAYGRTSYVLNDPKLFSHHFGMANKEKHSDAAG